MAGLPFVSCWGGLSSDPNVVIQALGVTVDMTSRTMGVRTRRFAMYVDDGEVPFPSFSIVLKMWHILWNDFSKKCISSIHADTQ